MVWTVMRASERPYVCPPPRTDLRACRLEGNLVKEVPHAAPFPGRSARRGRRHRPASLSVPATAIHGSDTEVTVGCNDTIFSQNRQNEPAVAIDPAHPTVVAAEPNDNIDMKA